MRAKKIIKKYGHGAGSITFFKDDCIIDRIDRGDFIEITALKNNGEEIPIPFGGFRREVIKQRSSALFCFPAEVVNIFRLKVGDVIEIEYNVIKNSQSVVEEYSHE